MSETFTVWVPSAKGAERLSGCSIDNGWLRIPTRKWCFYSEDREKKWFIDESAAREMAERMRLKEIASLKKRLATYEALGPHNAPSLTSDKEG